MIINNNNNNGDCDCGCNRQPDQVVPQTVKCPDYFELLLASNGSRKRSDFVRIAMNIGWSGAHWFYIGFGILGIVQIAALLCGIYALANYIHMIFNDGGVHTCHIFWLCRFQFAEIIMLGLCLPYVLMLIASYIFALYWLFSTDDNFDKKFEKE